MKRIPITIAIVILALFACKKKTEYCYWLGKSGTRLVYVWETNKPSTDQIQKVQDTCFCTLSLEHYCQPCKTDAGGNDYDCN